MHMQGDILKDFINTLNFSALTGQHKFSRPQCSSARPLIDGSRSEKEADVRCSCKGGARCSLLDN